MATIDLGRVRLVHQGTFDEETAYAFFDAVTYLGSSYVCINANGTTAGILPTDTDNWALQAAKGDTGAQGEQGVIGADGKSFTDATINDVGKLVLTLED